MVGSLGYVPTTLLRAIAAGVNPMCSRQGGERFRTCDFQAVARVTWFEHSALPFLRKKQKLQNVSRRVKRLSPSFPFSGGGGGFVLGQRGRNGGRLQVAITGHGGDAESALRRRADAAGGRGDRPGGR